MKAKSQTSRKSEVKPGENHSWRRIWHPARYRQWKRRNPIESVRVEARFALERGLSVMPE